MKNKTEFIKLLSVAILCHGLIAIGFILISMDVGYKYYNSAMDAIGFFILWNTISYVSQHELKRRIIKTKERITLFQIALEEERTWWRSML